MAQTYYEETNGGAADGGAAGYDEYMDQSVDEPTINTEPPPAETGPIMKRGEATYLPKPADRPAETVPEDDQYYEDDQTYEDDRNYGNQDDFRWQIPDEPTSSGSTTGSSTVSRDRVQPVKVIEEREPEVVEEAEVSESSEREEEPEKASKKKKKTITFLGPKPTNKKKSVD